MIERIIQDGRPISHVADEAGISRQRLTVWLRRYEMFGDAGLEDRSSRPARSPNQTSEDLEDRIEQLRRTTKYGPDRISGELAMEGVSVSPATVHRVLVRRGLNRLSTIDPPTGEDARQVKRYEHDAPGDMIHIDVKKVGKIPDGGGWRVHGRDSQAALESRRKGKRRPGYTRTCTLRSTTTAGSPTSSATRTNGPSPLSSSSSGHASSSPATASP